jgi:hypothetical protein
MIMKNLLKRMGILSARKEGRIRRVFKRNGTAMRHQLQKMGEMNQEFISVSAIRN